MEGQMPVSTEMVSVAPYKGLDGMHEGYDQPTDPISYRHTTNAQPGLTVPAHPYEASSRASTPQPDPGANRTVVVSQPATPVNCYDHLGTLALIISVCFCCPLGLAAAYYAQKAKEDAAAGRVMEARSNARVAVEMIVAAMAMVLGTIIAIIIYFTLID